MFYLGFDTRYRHGNQFNATLFPSDAYMRTNRAALPHFSTSFDINVNCSFDVRAAEIRDCQKYERDASKPRSDAKKCVTRHLRRVFARPNRDSSCAALLSKFANHQPLTTKHVLRQYLFRDCL